MSATSRLEAARAIIAEGCGCDQQCHCLSGADVYCGCRKDAEKILALPEDRFVCSARKQGSAGGNDPAECDWPVCGCDPYADKVIAALQEGERLLDRAYPEWPLLQFNKHTGTIERTPHSAPAPMVLPKGWRVQNEAASFNGRWCVNMEGPEPLMGVTGVGDTREKAWSSAIATIKDSFPA